MQTMRLSEAIRLGAMALPPVKGPIFARDKDWACGACAIGAPLFALYGHDALRLLDAREDCCVSATRRLLAARCPVAELTVTNPATGSNDNIITVMVTLFEIHGWTRESIADWVATIEAQQEQIEAPALVAVEG